MKELAKKWASVAGMTAGLLLAASPAHAVYNIVLSESGGNVVATGSGSINTAGVTLYPSFGGSCGNGFVYPSFGGELCTGQGYFGQYFNGAIGPNTLGTGYGASANSG